MGELIWKKLWSRSKLQAENNSFLNKDVIILWYQNGILKDQFYKTKRDGNLTKPGKNK